MSDAAQMTVVRLSPGEVVRDLVESATRLLGSLVSDGAALGWVGPPTGTEIDGLLRRVTDDAARGDAALVIARHGGELAGLGYWRRYARPTHRPHADVEKVAVSLSHQGRGVGRSIMQELVAAATGLGVEVLTLDLRGDNARAVALYESLGFRRYGRLERFVAVGEDRYDKLFYALDLRHASGRPPTSEAPASAR